MNLSSTDFLYNIHLSVFHYDLFYCKEIGIRNCLINKLCNIQLLDFFSADCFLKDEGERGPSNWLILILTMLFSRPRVVFFFAPAFSVSPLPVRISFIRSGTASLTPPGVFCNLRQSKSYFHSHFMIISYITKFWLLLRFIYCETEILFPFNFKAGWVGGCIFNILFFRVEIRR